MAVRARLRRGSRSMEVVVLVSSGAESDEPVVVVGPEVAEALGFSTEDFDLIEVELASGKTHDLISREKVVLELLGEEGAALSRTLAYLAVDDALTEPLITDAAIDELGIQVIRFKEGLWRHAADPPHLVRRSEPRP